MPPTDTSRSPSTGPEPDDPVLPGDPYWEDGRALPVGPDLVEDGYGDRTLPGLNYASDALPGRGLVLSGWTAAYALCYACVVLGVLVMLGVATLGPPLDGMVGGALFALGWVGIYVVQYRQNDVEHRIATGDDAVVAKESTGDPAGGG